MNKPTPSPRSAPKAIDCVDMKRKIQDQLARSQQGKSRTALNAAAKQRIAADPYLKRLLDATIQSVPVRKAG